jgi:hypothetical protein
MNDKVVLLGPAIGQLTYTDNVCKTLRSVSDIKYDPKTNTGTFIPIAKGGAK